MEQQEASKRIKQLRSEIERLNTAYFTHDSSLVPESVRDSLKKELIALENQYPDLVSPDSPTQRVGAPLDSRLPKIKHVHPKESLQDAFDRNDLDEWIDQMQRALGDTKHDITYEVELKIDGLNMSLIYERDSTSTQYFFTRAVTRGNGIEGEDVTHTIRTITSVPLSFTLPTGACKTLPDLLEIGGDVLEKVDAYRDVQHRCGRPVHVDDLPRCVGGHDAVGHGGKDDYE